VAEQTTSYYWLDVAAREIEAKFPHGEIVVSSGISPSASYHIGHFREILTADALAWALQRNGREVKHVHVVDDFDPLRKRYDFLPETFEQYVGQPICLIPDPHGTCHNSYADHFYMEFEGFAKQMGVVPSKVVRSYRDLYQAGKMAVRIEQVLEKVDAVREVFERVAGRELPADWTPVQALGQDRRFFNATIDSWSRQDRRIADADYSAGEAKLNWRLDWPARWAELGVMVEPFSAQEHGAAGGSYDTGVEFARNVFKIEPPIPGVKYANIHLVGDTKKMSSSKGNLVTPGEALEIMPAEVLRYFVVRSKPDRTLYFDPGLGLYNLIDEYSKVKHQVEAGEHSDFREAYLFASQINSHDDAETISRVPFNHLVSVYQSARGDMAAARQILRRTGFESEVQSDSDVLEREMVYVRNWLNKYAPDSVKFKVQDKLPKVELSGEQRQFLSLLGEHLGVNDGLDGQGMHDAIYDCAERAALKPQAAFQALYRIILAQDSGPKAGWFLASLERDWLIERLRAAAS
jgi:lysyl-tRNA synthetase, class I